MTPDSYTFGGDMITFIGLIGIISTGIILFTVFNRFYNSPLNK